MNEDDGEFDCNVSGTMGSTTRMDEQLKKRDSNNEVTAKVDSIADDSNQQIN